MKKPINGGDRPWRGREAARRRRPDAGEVEITVKPGQVAFRLLCHVDAVGGVIGSHGSIVKELEGVTGARIHFEPTLGGCLERVINVVGCSEIDRRIVWENQDGSMEECEISEAQDALFRVFERVLEVEGTENSNRGIGCRLLASASQIGPLMAEGGSIVDKIRKDTGLMRIMLWPKELFPDCASPLEELIQIMGAVSAVKKALLAVSHHLQLNSPIVLDTSSHALTYNAPTEVLPSRNDSSPYLPCWSDDSDAAGLSISKDVERKLRLDEDPTKIKVSYRLLCPANVAGGVIGKNGTVVRSIERDTGASIKMSAPLGRSAERIANISAVENHEPLFSSAQTALIQIFTKSIDVGMEQRKSNTGESVTARLLVRSREVSCLMNGGRVAPDIKSDTNVDICIFGEDLVPFCAGKDDRVIQINGDYEKVKRALFQVTGRLRDNLLTIATARGEPRKTSYPANQQSTKAMDVSHVSGRAESESSSTSFGDGPEHRSVEPAGVSGTSLVVMVPREFFDSIYGEDGSNLARIKKISGATITIDEPGAGEHEGKVTITGTADQAQRAKCLIHAFTLTVPSSGGQ